MEIRIIFTFNGMFMLYLENFCPGKFNGGNQNVFVKNSERHARDMFFWKRTIIKANKDYRKSCVLAQICIAYNLILKCRWHVNFDVNVFSNTKINVTIFHYKTNIAYTCCKQLSCTVLSIYPWPF